MVIDLSHQPHGDKIAYIKGLLPALNTLRHRTGLPHRIVVDEAHYFLHEARALELLDLSLNGYTIVTYCASRLPSELLAASEVMIVTCASNPADVDVLYRRCLTCAAGDRSQWARLGQLKIGQAIALPITEEAQGALRAFAIGPRITPHVRHRQKYVDVPVAEHRAFFFTSSGVATRAARTLRQFVGALEHSPRAAMDGFLRRGDFSRWIRDVFGDHPLASELQALEERFRSAPSPDIVADVIVAVRARYDLADELDIARSVATTAA